MNDNKKRGIFLSIEGGDAVGKTTAIAALRRIMEKVDIETWFTREPGGSIAAETIRECLLKVVGNKEEQVYPMTELLLVNAARYQHIENVIKPLLKEGHWVITDRFNDSTWAYQKYAGGIPSDHVIDIETMVLGLFQPNVVILLDADPNLIKDRMRGRADNNAFDEKDMEFKCTVRDGLLKRAARPSATKYYIIDTVIHDAAQVEDLLEIIIRDVIGDYDLFGHHLLHCNPHHIGLAKNVTLVTEE